jgi:Fe-S cluster assembly protein SufD
MTQLIDSFVDQPGAESNETAWLKASRLQGVNRFNTLGIPTLRDEDWKYTSLRALASKQYSMQASSPSAETASVGEGEAMHRLVFMQGMLDEAASTPGDLPEGVTLMSMREALAQGDALQSVLRSAMPEKANAFAELNNGLFRDGALLKIDASCHLDKPVELVFISGGEQTLCMPRNLIVMGAGARASVIERQLSDDESTGLSNSATEIVLAEDSRLDYNLIQLQGKKSTHIGGIWVQQAAGSHLSTRTMTLGGTLVRNELNVSLNGQGAHADCTGLFYGRQRQHMDNHTTIRHAAPECTSRELYKGILDDRARGVFHGRIVVEQDAQLTLADQQNSNLLLSRDSEIDTKPQLEIYADDVKCSHGATVGELDKNQLFYMQSRGIDMDSARTLLTYAFAAQVVEEIEIESLREELTTRIAEQMHLTDILPK